ncbi:lipopolysaccharide biosynthesis protein [Marinobacter hydrocarbonoclasticus]|nr:lipopolysaccharide biosynthesis protein [Marinobacter nauticus]MBY6214055.1 lipopolysaccharide biosynthesis protein [Marinobacter nauticus]
MAFAPVITRLYGPEAFGLLGTFLAALAIVMPVAALTYPIAIVLPKADRDAHTLAKFSACLAASLAALILLVLWAFGEVILAALGLQPLVDYMWLIPFAMVCAAGQQIFEQLLIRRKAFKSIARVAVAQSLTLNSAKTGLGAWYPAGATLIVLATAGQALYACFLWLGFRAALPAGHQVPEPPEPSRLSMWELAALYRDFPLFRAPQVMINALSQGLPVLMLASFSGPAAAGFYSLAKTVLGAPVLLISKSVGDVFYPKIAEAAQRKEPVWPLLRKATLALAGVGVFPFALVVAFGPWLFGLVFGSEWIAAGEYARWLALWLYFGFLNRPSVVAIQTLGFQKFFLMYEVVSVVLRIASLFLGFWVYESDLLAVIFFSITGVFLNCLLIGLTMYKSIRLNM